MGWVALWYSMLGGLWGMMRSVLWDGWSRVVGMGDVC